MTQSTYIPRKGEDAEFAALSVDSLSVNGTTIAGGLELGTSEVVDLNGEADALVIDADGDTTISAPTDDQIDFELAGADDFRMTANTFTALSGSTIATNTIAETTSAAGVTIDGVLLKDGGAVFADAATIEVDTVNEATSAAGVTIDGALLKDRTSDLGRRVQELTSSGAITINSGLVLLNHASVAVEATLDAPAAGDEFFIINNSASGTAAHTVTLSGATWNGTNAVATLDAPGEALHVVAISATRFFILENIGTVGLSG